MKDNRKYLCHSDGKEFREEIKGLLLFRKIIKAESLDEQTAKLTLDNGVEIITVGNEGCGGCGNGWFYLDELNKCENAITNIEYCIDEDYEDVVYKLFVFAEDKKINCLQYSGYDNGYYGTGFDVYVKVANNEQREAD